MLKNYFKTAFRYLWKNKSVSLLNIIGLALGLAVCMLIALYVIDELSYDKYNERAERIFRLEFHAKIGNELHVRTVPAAMGPALVEEYPKIEKFVRILEDNGGSKLSVKKGSETFIEPNAVFADSTLFDVFTLPMVSGNPREALKRPGSIVIAERMAKKYFNSTNVIGKTLTINEHDTYIVTGVIRDMPAQSHVHYNFIRPMSEVRDSRGKWWLSNGFVTYILVKPGTTALTIDNYLNDLTKKYIEPQLTEVTKFTISDLAKKGEFINYASIPLTDIHLHSNVTDEKEASGNIQYIYLFVVIAFSIVFIACVNFVNLSTAHSAGRAKEIGIRKVLGSQRFLLIYQFLIESVITCFIALVLALFIAAFLLPFFNQLSGKEITLKVIYSPLVLSFLILSGMFIGIMAGIYPALFLSSFRPMRVLKGKLALGLRRSTLRNFLVVFQFTAAIVLIISTLIVFRQLNFLQNKKLGYNREQILIIHNTYPLGKYAKAFRDRVLQLPGVEAATMTRFLPTNINNDKFLFSKNAAMGDDVAMGLVNWFVDADYIPTLGMKMLKGRNFSAQIASDSSSIIINETAEKLLQFKDPLNKYLYGNQEKLKIIGVMRDFNAGSLHSKIEPLILRLSHETGSIAFRVSGKNLPELIEKIKGNYYSIDKMAGQPFMYSFMDDDYNSLYISEQHVSKLFLVFAFFAISIACLGLLGLITYTAHQRSKEMSIRKVLGAGVRNIVYILTKDFLKLISLAIVLAFPIGWWLMHQWLQDFAYRVEIRWWIFATGGILALVIALVTISSQALRVARSNPVKSLRSE